MSEWKEVRLGDMCHITSSKRIFAHEYATHGIPFFRGKEIIEKQRGVNISNELYIAEEKFTEIKRKYGVPQEGDLLLTSVGTLGVPYVVRDEEFYFKDGNLTWFTNFFNLSVQYLYYWFCSPLGKSQINEKAIGSTQKALTITNLCSFVLKVPSLSIQNKIASILSSLDAKIETNNRINTKLEEMAQALFKSWFIDFEPFQDQPFHETELGMIPEGWRIVWFKEFITSSTERVGREDVPEYSVTNTGIHPRDEKFSKNLSRNSANNKLLCRGDLVFGMSREILNWGIMKDKEGGVSSAYNIYKVDTNQVDILYLENYIANNMDYFHDLIKPASREGQGLDKTALFAKCIVVPPLEVLESFNKMYNPLMEKIASITMESRRLAELRDALLPKLMNGEIEV